MSIFLSKEEYEKDHVIHDAFKDFIYKKTGWKIVTCNGKYHGLTAERFRTFKQGYLYGRKTNVDAKSRKDDLMTNDIK